MYLRASQLAYSHVGLQILPQTVFGTATKRAIKRLFHAALMLLVEEQRGLVSVGFVAFVALVVT